MFIIKIPDTYKEERYYILNLILNDFLGLQYNLVLSSEKNIHITSDDGREMVVSDYLFNLPVEQWLTKDSLPKQPLGIWDLTLTPFQKVTVNYKLPVIYGKDPSISSFFYLNDRFIYLGLDIFGSAFFMLTRYEEIINQVYDNHKRFSAKASLAFQEGFLERPIINEYIEILWVCLQYLWPNLARKKRVYKVFLTHDVDTPFQIPIKGVQIIKDIGKDFVVKHEFVQPMRKLNKWKNIFFNKLIDPYFNFDYILDLSEKNNLKSSFYFLADKTYDYYKIENRVIQNLLKNINERDHEIGLHASYNSFCDSSKIKEEFSRLSRICQKNKIGQNYWGGRHHYLRWAAPTTWQFWNDNGLDYDSTLGYADHIGFRCGICYQFPVFNLLTKKTLKLYERPLIIMEVTFYYMKLSWEQIYQKVVNTSLICSKYQGDFVLLWHNSSLGTEEEKYWYNLILKNIAK